EPQAREDLVALGLGPRALEVDDALETGLGGVRGGVERASGAAEEEVRSDAVLVQGPQHADLHRAQVAAATEHEGRAGPDAARSGDARGSVAVATTPVDRRELHGRNPLPRVVDAVVDTASPTSAVGQASERERSDPTGSSALSFRLLRRAAS